MRCEVEKKLPAAKQTAGVPVLNDFSIYDAMNDNHSYAYLFACRSNAKPGTFVRTLHHDSARHLVSFGHHLLYGKTQIGKASQPLGNMVLYGFRTTRNWKNG